MSETQETPTMSYGDSPSKTEGLEEPAIDHSSLEKLQDVNRRLDNLRKNGLKISAIITAGSAAIGGSVGAASSKLSDNWIGGLLTLDGLDSLANREVLDAAILLLGGADALANGRNHVRNQPLKDGLIGAGLGAVFGALVSTVVSLYVLHDLKKEKARLEKQVKTGDTAIVQEQSLQAKKEAGIVRPSI